MALLWWRGDRVRLVRNLAPPMAGPAAERALERIYQAYGRQLYREHHGLEPAGQARRELAALQKALSGSKPSGSGRLTGCCRPGATSAGRGTAEHAGGAPPHVAHHGARHDGHAPTPVRTSSRRWATPHFMRSICSVWCTAGRTACRTRHGISRSASPTAGDPLRSRSGACEPGTHPAPATYRAVGKRQKGSTATCSGR